MSAPAFAILAAPFMGPAAASKRGAATTDADFAAVLGEAAPVEAPVKSAAPAAPKKDAEVAPAPAEDAAPEVAPEAARVADTIVLPVPAPVTAPAPTLVADVEVDAEAVTAPPVAEVPTAPIDDLVPANNAAPAPTAEPKLAAAAEAAEPNLGAAVKTTAPADAPVAPPAPLETPASAEAKPAADLTAPAPEQPKAAPTPQVAAAAAAAAAVAAAAAAVVATPVTSPALRPAKSAETIAPIEAASSDETPIVAEAAPLEAPAAPAEGPRTRDVIDRALTGRVDAQGVSKNAVATADAAPQTDSAEPAAPVASSSPQPAAARPAVAEPAVLTLQTADDAVVATPAAATGQPVEARAAEPAVSLALSTVSHASIETTAQIAAQIVKKLEGRSVRFEMALTPEGLGNVDVSLDIDADGKLIAKMAFDNPLAATELRGRVDELRRQLQESGFTVADDALTFAERDASAGQHGGSAFDNRPDPRSARAFGAGARLSAEADIAVPSRWIPLTLTPDRVDMKV